MPRRHLALLLACAIAPAAHAAILNGRITGPGGNGVYPLDLDVYDNKSGAFVHVSGDTTDVNGNYSVTVAAGKYDLVFHPHPSLHLFDDARNGISVTTTTTTNRTLTAGRYLRGRVVDALGTGVAGVNLNFHSTATGASATLVQDDISGPTGQFQTLVPPGVWDVDVIPALASRKVPQSIDAVDLSTLDQDLGTLRVQNGFLVTGSITDAGLFPLSGADFDVRPAGSSSKLFTPTDNTSTTGVAQFVIPAGVYDITASPPSASTLATRTAWSVLVNGDVLLPNLALPTGVALTAHCVSNTGVPVVNADADADSLPYMRRLQTPHDATNATGDVSIQVSLYKFKVNFAPPVATKLLPVVFDSLQITGPRALGTVVHQPGHWVSVNVKEAFTNLPVQGVNLDFIDVATGRTFLTIDDVTNSAGFARVVTDGRAFNLLVRSPVAGLNTIVFNGFRSLQDTTLNLTMTYSTTSVGGSRAAQLELASPWPNPSRDGVHTAILSSTASDVELSAWDLAGRRVATVFRGQVLGRRDVQWDGLDSRSARVAPGVYLLRLSDGRTTTTRRVAVMR